LNYTRIFRKSLPVYSEGLKPSVSLKRRNPATGVPFRPGDVRADGYLFFKYDTIVAKKTGLLYERWYSPESFDKARDDSAKYYKANAKNIASQQAKYRKLNIEKITARHAKYRKANVEKVAACGAKYKKNNPGKVNAYAARRRAAKLLRTPPWLTKEQRAEIEAIYVLCAERTKVTGIPHAVDHVIPLMGRTVSGLHIAANLQIITASENYSKNNRYVQE
jgi:hypothetical protein